MTLLTRRLLAGGLALLLVLPPSALRPPAASWRPPGRPPAVLSLGETASLFLPLVGARLPWAAEMENDDGSPALRPQADAHVGLEEQLRAAAGMEEPTDQEPEEPALSDAQRQAATGRYQLPPEGFTIEHDPSRSIPCALGHPPLLWRVRVIDTTTGQTTYIGTGCCQTLFGITPAQIGAAQTATEHEQARLTKYAPWLPASSTLTETVTAIDEGWLDPARWQAIRSFLTQLDQHYSAPIAEVERQILALARQPRLVRQTYLTSTEQAALARVAPAFGTSPVAIPAPDPNEVAVLLDAYARLAKQPTLLSALSLRWGEQKTPAPMKQQDLALVERRMPNYAANLYAAQVLLPDILSGQITQVVDGGAGQETLYRLLRTLGGEPAARCVINVELDSATYAAQTENPRRLHMSVTDLASPITPPETPAAQEAAALLAAPEQVDAVILNYTLDQLRGGRSTEVSNGGGRARDEAGRTPHHHAAHRPGTEPILPGCFDATGLAAEGASR